MDGDPSLSPLNVELKSIYFIYVHVTIKTFTAELKWVVKNLPVWSKLKKGPSM